jgi:muramidase (phage lysozyme)
VSRSPIFDQVDPQLLKALHAVGDAYAPYKVGYISGYRPGDPRFHGKGRAVDVQLSDPKTGAALANYQDAAHAQAYQQYANAVYQWAQQNNPELAQRLRWGGYFSGGTGKYGAFDLMHFDTGGGPGGMGMAGGSWAGGWTPEMMDTWGLKGAGGTGGVTADYDPYRQAFLDTIAAGESPGYDVMYGGKKFTDFSRHPHQAQTANGITSDVAGRYQFKGSTWDELQQKYKYKDFSQANQDAAAWQYAQDIYSQKTNGDKLAEALQSGDPGRMNAAATVLNQTWSSLPGGKEQSKGYGTRTFADLYGEKLKAAQANKPAAGGSSTPPADDGGGNGGYTPPPPASDKPDEKNAWTMIADGLKSAGTSIGSMKPINRAAPPPGAAISDAEQGPPPVVAANPNRAQLAQLMLQRLNSGRLF